VNEEGAKVSIEVGIEGIEIGRFVGNENGLLVGVNVKSEVGIKVGKVVGNEDGA
jgi:hypothetical protein